MTEPLLSVRDIAKHYPAGRGATVRALDGVSFDLRAGETLGIVGESGCGKSTLGRAILRLTDPTRGAVRFEGSDLTELDRRALRRRRRDMQMVFQDPFGSLNPRHKVAEILAEPLEVHKAGDRAERRRRIAELLDLVGLDPSAADRYPHEFSGGQRQRISIARAIALSPKLVIADEPVSALDVSIQSQILNLLVELRRRLGLALIIISHDLAVIRHISDRVMVMYLGEAVEMAAVDDLFDHPAHPYTQALLSAIPRPDRGGRRDRVVLAGDLPDPATPIAGCPFHTRCPKVMERCRHDKPALTLRQAEDGIRFHSCHLNEPAEA
ncbi:dipeptide ABC transporter ATP-binding protein [Inquilinus sp. CAU 1745]|uniref:ABC transporter ATP-binding protein n=1 Tax=Inquilinus sp. CAU 1745 TaxID=3140369 RepID=UPI00325B02F6